jgi:hypothetical protein
MSLKGIAFVASLWLTAATGAAALPLSHTDGLTVVARAVQTVRYHRCFGRCRTVACPVWYERTFWGSYRLYSPCSNRVNIHLY